MSFADKLKDCANVAAGVGVRGGVGVGPEGGIGSDDGTSRVCTRETWPPVVRNAKPFARQRIKLPVGPLTPGISEAPLELRVVRLKVRSVRTAHAAVM